MADIRIKVGAIVDLNTDRVFGSFAASATRAARTIAREQDRSSKQATAALERETRRKQAIIERSAAMAGRLASKQASAEISEARRAEREAERLQQQQTKAVERESGRRLAWAKKASTDLRRMEEQERRRRASQVGAGFTGALRVGGRLAGAGVGMASRLAMGVARSAGVQLDSDSYVRSYVGRQSLATDIVNSGYIPGAKGANGQRQSASDVMADTMGVAKATAIDPTKALEGLQKFVAVTGDLETGRAVLGDMAKLSKATGSSMEDVVEAAGEISAKLGDIPNKAGAINAIMMQIAGQGKLGAVEMRDFAGQLAKIAAVAPQFAGNTQKNIGEMAVLMQEARQHGGAANAAQAATGVMAFTQLFDKGARDKAFKSLTGTSSRDSSGKLRSPEALILDVLQHASNAKGQLDSVKVGTVFASAQARKVTRGFETIYNDAGGGNAGLRAVHEEFERLRKATMTQTDVDEQAARAMDTAESRVQAFNNKMQEVSDQAIPEVLKALNGLAPAALTLAPLFGELAVGITQAMVELAKSFGLISRDPTGPNDQDVVGDATKLHNIATGQTGNGKIDAKELEDAKKNRDALYLKIADEKKQLKDDETLQDAGVGSSGTRKDREAEIGRLREQTQRDEENLKNIASAVKEIYSANRVLSVRIVGGAPPTPNRGGTTPPARPGAGGN